MIKLKYQREYPVPVEGLWNWHAANGAFERLQPTWQRFRLEKPPESLEEGAVCQFSMRQFGLWLRWKAKHGACECPRYFSDRQVQGPFKKWEHMHRFEELTSSTSRLEDDLEIALPIPFLSEDLLKGAVTKEIDRVFQFRQQRLADDLKRYGQETPGTGKKVLITGASGGIGKRLIPLLKTLGFEVRSLSRRPIKSDDQFYWNPETFEVDEKALEGLYGVIHLAGHPIAASRWSDKVKAAILESRSKGTRFLVETLKRQKSLPEVFISASGVNFYEANGTPQTESEFREGKGFLATVCREWEEASAELEGLGVKRSIIRTGIVLDPLSGALSKMLLPFKAALGGPVGGGHQHFPWISVDDLCDLYAHLLIKRLEPGIYNGIAPDNVSQGEFAKQLGEVLKRPSIIPLPTAVVKILFGQMGEETLLADLNIQSTQLTDSGYSFRHPSLRSALSFLLGK